MYCLIMSDSTFLILFLVVIVIILLLLWRGLSSGVKGLEHEKKDEKDIAGDSFDRLAKLAIDQWNRKISAPSDQKKILLDADIQCLKYLSGHMNELESDEYAKWFAEEINHAIHNDLSRAMFMSSVSSSLANAGDNTLQWLELQHMSSSQIFHNVYMAGLKILSIDPLVHLENKAPTDKHKKVSKLRELGEWPTTVSVISTTFNLMVAHGCTRDKILEEHFFIRYKRFIVGKGPRNSLKRGIWLVQKRMADEFICQFKLGIWSSTSEYVCACIFIEYYPKLLLEMGNGDGTPVFASLVASKNDEQAFVENLSQLTIDLIIHHAKSVIANLLKDMDVEERTIIDSAKLSL